MNLVLGEGVLTLLSKSVCHTGVTVDSSYEECSLYYVLCIVLPVIMLTECSQESWEHRSMFLMVLYSLFFYV